MNDYIKKINFDEFLIIENKKKRKNVYLCKIISRTVEKPWYVFLDVDFANKGNYCKAFKELEDAIEFYRSSKPY